MQTDDMVNMGTCRTGILEMHPPALWNHLQTSKLLRKARSRFEFTKNDISVMFENDVNTHATKVRTICIAGHEHTPDRWWSAISAKVAPHPCKMLNILCVRYINISTKTRLSNERCKRSRRSPSHLPIILCHAYANVTYAQ